MRLLNVFILGLIGVSLPFHSASQRCNLLTISPLPPLTVTQLGSKHWVSVTGPILTLESSESVDLYCESGFKYYIPSYGRYEEFNANRTTISCKRNRFILLDHSSEPEVESVSCRDNAISPIFESRTSMPNCEGYMSLVVGRAFEEFGSLKRFAICYDIDKQQLKYISYTAYTKWLEPTQAGQLNRLGLDIEVIYSQHLFKPYGSESVEAAFRDDRRLMSLFGAKTFEYATLIQDEPLSSGQGEFKEMLSIIWLRALLNGNWRHFLNALKSASINAKYDVNVGVSGTISLPTTIACNDSRQLSVELDSGYTVTVPALIWAQVRAVAPNANVTEEFVIIAHNSPFLKIDERNELCESMCHEVPWLRQSLFGKLQQYPVYGLAQCCHVADVQHKLENFPKSQAAPNSRDLPPLPPPFENLRKNTT
ncbi:PREDICTED: uncharacterized protein LOC108620242 isoform X1 [Drosophila arizonae]|uniref:Uncharacterized protein LOC108620242 isoform X1 n=1 Tax=Drosophila arizonae TaxID=7263 RepID=A0ABM1PZK0_DROAR|nr:PREDICTED: uncharacterized protein LOC108620242 isoform X1 [Drosophila arizonae]